MKRYKSVDDYIDGADEWQVELKQLRKILDSTQLEEEVKWGAPCYTYRGKNIVGMGAFKSYVGLWFHQGALLEDKQKVLINAQEGKTKALRQWRFENRRDIKATQIKAYVKEAIALVDEGKEIKPDRAKPVTIPPELEKAFKKNKKARTCFDSLTKGKQREYTDYIAGAKRDETKAKRIEKIFPMILDKVGLHDKYRDC